MRQLTKRPSTIVAAPTDALEDPSRSYNGDQQYATNVSKDSTDGSRAVADDVFPSYSVQESAGPAWATEKSQIKKTGEVVGTKVDSSVEERRAKRMRALMKMRDLWDKSNPGIGPIDGVEYQKAMRAEW